LRGARRRRILGGSRNNNAALVDNAMIDRFFGITASGSTVRTEIVAGATTYLTMAYIAFVNPMILADAGMDRGAVFVATCLAAAGATLLMALWTNYPIALAPGMGINAYFTYDVVKGLHYPWQTALGAVFLSGLLFLIISLSPLRRWLVAAIPRSQKMAISAGIGLFLGIIALKDAGIVVAHPQTLVALGDLGAPAALLAACGFVAMVALDRRGMPGALILAVLAAAGGGIALGVSPFFGVVSLPPSLDPTFLRLDIGGALQLGVATIVFVFLFVDLFDNTGTLIGVAQRAGLLDAAGRLPRAGRAFATAALAALGGAVLGTATVTSYIESAAGVKAGGRTGLVGATVAALFVLTLFLAPLAHSVPVYATAPALLFVACMMARGFAELDWDDASEYAPAMVTALTMPLTFSIATGIALGFICYVGVKLLSGRIAEAGPVMSTLATLFILKYALF
jgi:AGZA family xanthine/uracil permease-like MFS transporter